MDKNTCFCCKKQFMLYDLRPYGPDKSTICYMCSRDPKYADIVHDNIERALDETKAEARRRLAAGEQVAIRLDESRGPMDISDRAKA